MRPDETDEERLEQISPDEDRPFEPEGATGDDTHPTTDSELDTTEVYQDGVESASNMPSPDDADEDDIAPLSGIS